MAHRSQHGRPLITLDNVTIRSGGALVFRRTTWGMRAGEQWAIVGPNGSGKSTLAKAISGALPTVGGEIVYHFDQSTDDEPLADRPWHQAQPEDLIAHVSFDTQRELLGGASAYQQARWHAGEGGGAPTALEVISSDGLDEIAPYLVEPRPVRAADFDARVRQVLRQLGIGYLANRRILHLSNGEAHKVLIARALVRRPRLLILDDPFGGLDTQSRRMLKTLIGDLMRRGTRVLLVTARADDIPPGVTHVLRVADRRVVAAGTRRQVLGKPLRALQRTSSTTGRRQAGAARRRAGDRKPSATPLVRMRHVGVAYDGIPILTRITWQVRPGQRWALLGPNGAGKSTLLSLILGDNPQAYANDDLELFGQRRGSGESIWEIKDRIGHLSPELLAHYQEDLSCHQVVCSGYFDSIGLYERCSRLQRRNARSWMERLDIGHLRRKPFLDISSGLQRLVLLARALVKDPPLLILDEPCQDIDAEHRDTILAVLDRVCDQTNRAMVYVTHRRDELPGCITHVVRLRHGRIVAQGTRRTVLGR